MFTIAREFKFPDVGEGIHEGTIVKWLFKEGDSVKADQTIVEVETDKAVVELPAPNTGTILKINFGVGQVIKVGEVLVVIGEPGETVASAAPSVSAHVPEPASQAPKPQTPAAIAPIQSAAPSSTATIQQTPGHGMATPATRKLARELGVDLAKIQGTGPGGRITEDDVKKASSGQGTAPQAKTQMPASSQPVSSVPAHTVSGPQVKVEEGDQVIVLTPMRKVIAERMLYSKTHIPHACGMDYVDVTKLSELREKEKKNFEPKGIKLTYLPFIVKACAIALKENPYFNAYFDNDKNEIILKKQHNIGIAVDTPEGLMVPVIKDVDRRSVVEIAQEIEHLATQARDRKVKLEDLRGGTFTITNVGSIGGMYSSPIINPPEVAILGVHRIKEVPAVVDGKIKPRKILGLSICFDHRVVDGAAGMLFLNTVMKHLEDPDLMLVEMI